MRIRNRVFVIVVGAALAVGAIGGTGGEPASDPAYKQLSQLVGGTWEFTSADLEADAKWTLAPDGVSLHGETTISPKGGKTMHAIARFGWDPVAKKVYYLDAHDSETVYLGLVHEQSGVLDARFKTVVGPSSEWSFKIKFDGPDRYTATLYPVQNGKVGEAMVAMVWNRKK